MRAKSIIILLVSGIFLNISCSKSEDKAVVDCFGDSILTQLKHSADGTNPKIINYSIEYSGSNTITSVKWTFGDGKTETVNSATGAVSHTYTAAGAFNVVADVNISKGGSSCTINSKKSVTVN